MNKRIGATLFILFALLGQIIGIGFVKVEIFQVKENVDKNSGLHTAATTFIIPSVPHYFQTTNYYCGPASLEMVYDFYGPDIPQLEIADASRADPSYGCYTDDMRRATHFSRLSTSVGMEMPGSITGYTNRKIGYGAFEVLLPSISYLIDIIDDGHPMVVLQWYDLSHSSGHFRVVIGYIENGGITTIITHDPWYTAGPYYNLSYSTFMNLWAYSSNWALFICPWDVTVSCSSSVALNSTFTVRANVEYVIPASFSPVYPASTCKATIQLPVGFSLAPGEMETKNLSPANLPAGDTGTATWQVVADVLNTEDLIFVNASGSVSGSVSAHSGDYFYPAYDYTDLIGGSGSKLVKIVESLPKDENLMPIIIITSAIIGAAVLAVVIVLIVRMAKRTRE
ncbi:MAG: C39 family peptidase [Candidatus Hodarchaeota archaeon]